MTLESSETEMITVEQPEGAIAAIKAFTLGLLTQLNEVLEL